jgi:hypothetical protein
MTKVIFLSKTILMAQCGHLGASPGELPVQAPNKFEMIERLHKRRYATERFGVALS